MSAPQKFRDLPTALAAYRAGTCRRWVEVDGWQIDLVQAAEPSKVARPGADEPRGYLAGSLSLVFVTSLGRVVPMSDPPSRDDHDRAVAASIADALRTEATVADLPPLADPEIAAPPLDDASAYRCPWCSRPWDGAK